MVTQSKLAALLFSSVLSTLAVTVPAFATPVFINEIHYDNAGADAGEAIEIAGPAGVDVSNWSLVLYNGNDGAPYNTLTLSGVIANLTNDYGTLVFNYSVNSLQNGSPDGVALVDDAGVVQQFLSYEGVLTAVGGAADGLTSIDIGVSENNSVTLGYSLQLSGSGTEYEDFIWSRAAPDSFGAVNFGQSFDPTTPPPPVVSSCGEPATLISQIQGRGDVSPLSGETHSIEAVVVGNFQGGTSFNGFYVQEQDVFQDADITTSEGLFVASNLLDVNIGDVVRVSGVVTESFGLTSLASVSSIEVCASGVNVAETNVSLPFDPTTNNAEWFEGMKINLPQTLTVSENFNLARFGEVVVSAGRLMIPTQVALPGASALAVKAQNDLNRLIIDDGLSVQNPDPVIFPAPGLSASNTLRSADSVTGARGVLSFGFNAYRLEPTQPLSFVADNARTSSPTNLTGVGSLRVASLNVLNFFNGDGLGGGFPTSRGADTLQEFERQKAKIVNAIIALDADVVGLMEIENDGYGVNSAIAQLVNEINALSDTGVSGAGTYAFVNPGVNAIGTDAIAVGMLYKPAKVSLLGSAQILDTSVDARFLDSKNRPTLAQTLHDLTSGKTLTIAVNHFKSKGSPCDDVGDINLGDGQGNCNITRTQAALALADWLASDPTVSHSPNFLIMGDLNSYAMEDPITALRNAGYTNLVESFIGDNAYSFVFAGESGYLDHALSSTRLTPQIKATSDWHINADEPRALDYNEEFKSPEQVTLFYNADIYRASDHDPIVVELLVAGDLDNDGDVDVNDYILLRSKLGLCNGDSDFLAEADYNHSSCVGYADYRIWYAHYRAYLTNITL